MKRHTLLLASALAALTGALLPVEAAQARDQLHIVGSSTVFPFSTAVAEAFGKAGKFKTPVVESTGTGGGLKLFCAGAGDDSPDIANASRAIKDSELADCKKNGVTSITEVTIGYDGIVLSNSKKGPQLKLTVQDVWLALAKEVPVGGKLAANPYKTWADVNKNLPAEKIEVLGPPPTSGTRDAFLELVMEKGCKGFAEVKALADDKAKKAACDAIREDGGYVDSGENDNLVVQKLESNPTAIGIFGYSYLEQNEDKLQASVMDGQEATVENIIAGKYEVSRLLYFYVKNQHVGQVPGIKEYITEFMSEKAAGEDGYLADKGMIPLPKDKYEAAKAHALSLESMM